MSEDPQSARTTKRARIGERTMLACTHCKSKKLKCDGHTPKCQNCVRSGRECLVEDPATGLQRPRDYLQSLETRVAYLESLLQRTRPEVAVDHLNDEGGDQNVGQLHDMSRAQPALGNDHLYPTIGENESIDRLSTEVALLCLSAAEREPHYFGPSCAVSFSRIVSATMGLPKRKEMSQPEGEVLGTQDPEVYRTLSVPFPSTNLSATLSSAYFKNIHPQYPFLHRPTFEAWEEICVRANIAGSLDDVDDLPLFFVLMVYAIGSLALGPAHCDSAEAYYSRAMDHQAAILDMDSLESIQSILACAVYSTKSSAGASLWKISGIAIRHCIELGYHRSVAKFRKQTDSLTAEISRRCFWVAYDIDRVAATILGRPFGIPDDAIDAELPCDLEDEYITRNGYTKQPRLDSSEQPTYMSGAIHVIKLRQLWSKFADCLYPNTSKPFSSLSMTRQSSISHLRQELEEWRVAIPDHIDYLGTQPLSVFASKTWFQLAYAHSILLLYRHHITKRPGPGEEQSVEVAFEQCALRAREICLLYRRLYQSPTIQFTWGSLHIFFMAGLTYLYCLWRCKVVREAARQPDIINTCMACNVVLVIMAERWPQATTYRDTFETLSRKTISMICNGFMQGSAVSPNSQEGSVRGPTETDQSMIGQDWYADSNSLPTSNEQEWFVQELFQDMRNYQPPDITYDDLVDFTT
ncbi:hypothetical protein G6011_07613 [Alternaria panax]|uniref:Zn(2)-C6 fungal-type domain-containing protein n=1 Tax=Alternaria panax TaxID=48097 RepID=A0AAD4I7J8_9PLEO|nr:hypothetical protein G6011_07613 [Alternaria panax]